MDVRAPQAMTPAYRGAKAYEECLRRISARSVSICGKAQPNL